MEYLVLADTHLGCTKEDKLSKLQLLVTQNANKHIIWNGDIFDTLVYENAYQVYHSFIRKDDIVLCGNHDFNRQHSKYLTIVNSNKRVFITHGDLLDFGMGFKILENLSLKLIKELRVHQLKELSAICTLLKVMNPFKVWSMEDVYYFYEELIALSDADINAYENKRYNLDTLKSYLTVLNKLLYRKSITKTTQKEPLNYKLLFDGTNNYGGLFTLDPKVLLERSLLLYPESRDCDILIFGHMHHAIDKVIKASNGKEYRLIVLGAWVGDVNPSYITINTSSPNLVEVKEII